MLRYDGAMLQRAHLGLLCALATGSVLAASCFDGADALGLPCERDDDCGRKQRCVSNVCVASGTDTPPDTCGDGIVNEGEECDDGNTVDDDDCSNACTAARCGDGIVQGQEQCDDGNTVDDDACSNACLLTSCGDGIVQPGEACDDGNDINDDMCSNACTEAVCGDGIVQATLGEECDDGNTVDDGTCWSDCTLSWLWDDAEQDVPGLWTVEVGDADPGVAWSRSNSTGANGGAYAWSSGWQPDSGQTPGGVAGNVRLVSKEIDLTNAESGPVILRFWQRYDFNQCDPNDTTGEDGGLVEVAPAGQPWAPAVPMGGYPSTLADTCDMLNPPKDSNPLTGKGAWTEANTQWEEVRVDLTSYAGQKIRVAFDVGFDCSFCADAGQPLGWLLDDIAVARDP